MTQHRIFGSEADQPRPLAYVSMFRTTRRKHRGYLAAAGIGVLLTLAAGVAMVLVGGGLTGAVH
jgi:hypothetical protein